MEPIRVLIVTQAPMPEPLLETVRAVSPRLRVEAHTGPTLEALGDIWAEAEVLYTTYLLPAPEAAPRP